MRLTALTTLLALGAVACGGGSKPDASQAAAAVPATANAAAAPPAPTTAAVGGEVKINGNGTTKAAFEAATPGLKTGTPVRVIKRAGGPQHDTLSSDAIP